MENEDDENIGRESPGAEAIGYAVQRGISTGLLTGALMTAFFLGEYNGIRKMKSSLESGGREPKEPIGDTCPVSSIQPARFNLDRGYCIMRGLQSEYYVYTGEGWRVQKVDSSGRVER